MGVPGMNAGLPSCLRTGVVDVSVGIGSKIANPHIAVHAKGDGDDSYSSSKTLENNLLRRAEVRLRSVTARRTAKAEWEERILEAPNPRAAMNAVYEAGEYKDPAAAYSLLKYFVEMEGKNWSEGNDAREATLLAAAKIGQAMVEEVNAYLNRVTVDKLQAMLPIVEAVALHGVNCSLLTHAVVRYAYRAPTPTDAALAYDLLVHVGDKEARKMLAPLAELYRAYQEDKRLKWQQDIDLHLEHASPQERAIVAALYGDFSISLQSWIYLNEWGLEKGLIDEATALGRRFEEIRQFCLRRGYVNAENDITSGWDIEVGEHNANITFTLETEDWES